MTHGLQTSVMTPVVVYLRMHASVQAGRGSASHSPVGEMLEVWTSLLFNVPEFCQSRENQRLISPCAKTISQ